MRILFIHEVNYRNKVIFEMHEFPELLSLRGHDVTFFHYPEHPDRPRRSLRTKRELITGRVHPDARITLVTPPTFGGGSAERYIAPFLSSPALRREVRSGNYDVVVLYAVPTTGWQTIAFARRIGLPVVFRALDVSHKIRKSLVISLVRAAEKFVYRNATVLSANNPALAEYCVQLSGRSGPTRVNLPPIDLTHFQEVTAGDGDVRAELGIAANDKVLLYMGTFFGFSGLDTVLVGLLGEFARHPDLKLVLVGGGELEPRLRELVGEYDLDDRVKFTGIIPYAKLPGYLRIADVAINPFVPEMVTHVALPHKVLQYMAAGIPAVSTALRGIQGILGAESGVTWVEGPDAVAGTATALAYQHRSEREDIASRQRSFVTATFSKESSVDALEELLQGLL